MLSRIAGLAAAAAAALALTQAASAQTPTAQSQVTGGKFEQAQPSLIADRAAVAPGDSFQVALRLKLNDTWHVYWKNPGDSGLAPAAKWTLPEGVTAADFKWPAPEAIPLATMMNFGYEHELVLPAEFKVPANAKPGETVTLAGAFDWLICQDICIPENAELSLTLPVEATPRTDDANFKAIFDSLSTAPVPLSGAATVQRTADGFKIAAVDSDLAEAAKTATNIRFFPNGPEIINKEAQPVRRGDAGVSLDIKASEYAKPGDQDLPGIIVVSGGDGKLKSWDVPAKPGAVPPGVADTQVKGSASKSGGAAAEPFTIVSLMLALGAGFVGGIVLNLMPCVLPVLAVKAAGLAATAHNPKEARAHGVAYLGGVLVCFAALGGIVVALQAAGQFAGFGFQLQYAPVVAFFTLVIFALGLNLLGVFEVGGSLMGVGGNLADKGGSTGAFFSGVLAAFVGAPCIGPFMAGAAGWALQQNAAVIITMFLAIGLGLAAPFVLLSFTPAFAKIIPKPGRWMATLRQVLAFPMFLTMLWLLWTLAGQTGADGVLVVLAGAITVGFGIWLATKIGSSLPGKIAAGVVILAAFVVPSAATAGITAPTAGATAAAGDLNMEPWSVEKVAQLQSENRVIFVDFTARWCVTCQVNKQVALHSDKVRKAFEANNVAFLEADWTNRDSVIADELAKHSRAGVPLYLVYPSNGGDPVVLPQVLTPGLVEKAVRDAAGSL